MTRTLIIACIYLFITLGCTNNVSYISHKQLSEQLWGWDLTYNTILDKSNIYDKWLIGWLQSTDSTPINIHYAPIINELSKNSFIRIKRSALFTFPAFHAGEKVSYLFYQIDNVLHGEIYINDSLKWKSSKISLNKFITLLDSFRLWQLSSLKQCKEIKDWKFNNSYPYFMGIISIYMNSKSYQIKIPCQYIFNIDSNIIPKDDFGIFVFSLNGLAKEI